MTVQTSGMWKGKLQGAIYLKYLLPVMFWILFRFNLLGGSWYLGGAAWDGTGLWISVYYPNNLAALYKVDVTAKQIVDTIQVFGIQPTGITVKGDTLFYVMDGFEGPGKYLCC